MEISKNGLDLIRKWEGQATHLYYDAAGFPTIGIGHLLTKSEGASGKIIINYETVRIRDGLSDKQCLQLLMQDLKEVEDAVNLYIFAELNQNQYDTLVSFAFNVGVYAFKESTLLKLLNQLQYDQAPAQLRRWIRSGGQIINGLITRRENEIKLWETKEVKE
ncbi:MAG: lysozyme [Elusimicrobia bacterium]|nr:lysozyme [Elusimicrobiota bacterium]